MKVPFDPKWRAQAKWKRVFYARYMTWLEWLGFVVVACVIGGFIFAFNYRVDDVVKADSVALQLAGVEVVAPADGTVNPMVAEWAEVAPGQPIFRWEDQASVNAGMGGNEPQELKAPKAGAMLYVKQGAVKKGDIICRIVDTGKVSFRTTVTGDTVAKTAVGQTVRLKDVAIGSSAATLRIVSGEYVLVTKAVDPQLNLEGLGDFAVQLPDDRRLAVKGVKSAEIDLRAGAFEHDAPGLPVNPSSDKLITGQVTAETPLATVQLGDLPPAWQEAFAKQLQSTLSQTPLQAPDGKSGTLHDLRDMHAVIKLSASGDASETASLIPATKVDRSSEVDVLLNDPPAALLEALRLGLPVTAKVEVVTGNRPIAFILLKKS